MWSNPDPNPEKIELQTLLKPRFIYFLNQTVNPKNPNFESTKTGFESTLNGIEESISKYYTTLRLSAPKYNLINDTSFAVFLSFLMHYVSLDSLD